jgi:hypothetical protein
MRLINTDGLVLIGPGSEWLWTAISGLVLAITFLAIWRQLALARSANAFQQIEGLTAAWETELLARHKLAILEAIAAGVPLENIPEGSATVIENFWEHTGALVRAGHIDAKMMYPQYGPIIRYWHAVVTPNVRRYRAESRTRVFESLDWLAERMAEVDRARGDDVAIDEAYIRSTLGRRIERFRDEIRQAEQVRMVVVQPRRAESAHRASTATGRSMKRATTSR